MFLFLSGVDGGEAEGTYAKATSVEGAVIVDGWIVVVVSKRERRRRRRSGSGVVGLVDAEHDRSGRGGWEVGRSDMVNGSVGELDICGEGLSGVEIGMGFKRGGSDSDEECGRRFFAIKLDALYVGKFLRRSIAFGFDTEATFFVENEDESSVFDVAGNGQLEVEEEKGHYRVKFCADDNGGLLVEVGFGEVADDDSTTRANRTHWEST